MANISELKSFKNGTVRRIIIKRPVKVMSKLIKKDPSLAEVSIVKITQTAARIGVSFEKMKGYVKPEESNEEKRPNTGHYLEGERNRILETSTGKTMVCLKTAPNPKTKGKVTWLLNGKEVKYSEIEFLLYAKDKRKEDKKELLGYMVDINNLTVLPAKNKEVK